MSTPTAGSASPAHAGGTVRTVVVTGASGGIGAAAARALAAAGHHVVVVGRDPARTAAVARETGGPFHLADFGVLDDVRRLADELAAYDRIDVLANNAGGIFGDPTPTVDGFERTFQVNHLAPYLLTTRLLDVLVASRASVIQTSSVGARLFGHLRLDEVATDTTATAHQAYGTAKLANILMTVELHRRFHGAGLSAAAFHPGIVATGFAASSPSVMRGFYTGLARWLMTSPERGARTLVRLATTTPGVNWRSGDYLERGRPARRLNPQARDAALASALWTRSAELVGEPDRDASSVTPRA
ncbi:SDR family NAD(P)-dependent oxidoreductase [Cellulomonas triticagri]|uniref:SDR family NAD(P)-dependent oxidoreductase n=1 Tax=Cellulomonas triticagri TaxID=2483352 RepID=A0A3M2JD12_9CELL|nr:SDR family NAD(P)-dependent oxidoreductase [Cellulomonas triticagri]RMI09473.1 SDR family NAD(P)-dependent oxidoreductase [Cellulomonas triticagri]